MFLFFLFFLCVFSRKEGNQDNTLFGSNGLYSSSRWRGIHIDYAGGPRLFATCCTIMVPPCSIEAYHLVGAMVDAHCVGDDEIHVSLSIVDGVRLRLYCSYIRLVHCSDPQPSSRIHATNVVSYKLYPPTMTMRTKPCQ